MNSASIFKDLHMEWKKEHANTIKHAVETKTESEY